MSAPAPRAASTAPVEAAHPAAAVTRAVSLVARAAQRVRAYPDGSPLVGEAIDAAHRALATLDREALIVRVTPRVLLVDELPVPPAPAVTELAARLHQASIGTATIARDGSARDLVVFCRELVNHDARESPAGSLLPDALQDRGVQRVAVTVFERPEVLPLTSLGPGVGRRRPHVTPGTRVVGGHLYPQGKGWVRLDPASREVAQVTLNDLAHLVGDPFALAEMLVRLSGDPPPASAHDALAGKFEEIAALFRAADPATAEGLLARLAQAVLALDPERRRDLLRGTVLPGLLDGRIDGAVLRHLPDIELAGSLALLLDLQVAAPELLTLALDRLELPDERRARVQPLIEEHIAVRHADLAARPGAIDGYDDGRIVVDLSREKEFTDFARFDLAIDAATETAIAGTLEFVGSTRLDEERRRCLAHLVRLQANPDSAAGLIASLQGGLEELRRAGEWRLLAGWIERLSELQGVLAAERPEIAELVAASGQSLLNDTLVLEMFRMAEREHDSDTPGRVFKAAGPAIVPALVRVLEGRGPRPPAPLVLQVVAPHAASLAPALGIHLSHESAAVVREVTAILAAAGPGVEPLLDSALSHADERVAREACRGLAHIGTAVAVRAVSSRLAAGGSHAELLAETLWRFPLPLVAAELRRLLSDDAFVSRHPGRARELIRKASARSVPGLGPVLQQLAKLRLHIWRPSRVLVGLAAARAGGGHR